MDVRANLSENILSTRICKRYCIILHKMQHCKISTTPEHIRACGASFITDNYFTDRHSCLKYDIYFYIKSSVMTCNTFYTVFAVLNVDKYQKRV